LLFESSWFVEPNLQEKLSPKAATTVLSKLRSSNGNDNGEVPNLETTLKTFISVFCSLSLQQGNFCYGNLSGLNPFEIQNG